MSNIKDKVTDAGHKVVEGAKQAVEYVKEKTGIGCTEKNMGVSGIKERMDVIAACGTKVGVVDHVEGESIKLTRKDSSDDQHHFIPKTWVQRVDNHVHLKKNSVDTKNSWKSDVAACGSCSG